MTDLETFLCGYAAMFQFRRQMHAIHTMPATDAAEVDELRQGMLGLATTGSAERHPDDPERKADEE